MIAWGPTLLWMLLIFYLSSEHAVVASSVKWQDFAVHKSAHVVLYFILAVWIYRSLKLTTKLRGISLIFWTIVITAAYALSDEFHQSFTPTRTPALRDVVIDTFGALIGATWAAKIIYGARRRL